MVEIFVREIYKTIFSQVRRIHIYEFIQNKNKINLRVALISVNNLMSIAECELAELGPQLASLEARSVVGECRIARRNHADPGRTARRVVAGPVWNHGGGSPEARQIPIKFKYFSKR